MGEKYHVLIVEDDADIRDSLRVTSRRSNKGAFIESVV